LPVRSYTRSGAEPGDVVVVLTEVHIEMSERL
jgi:hypothetical protein